MPVGEFHGDLDVLISKGHLKVLTLDYSISKIALECARDFVFFRGMPCIPPAARHLE